VHGKQQQSQVKLPSDTNRTKHKRTEERLSLAGKSGYQSSLNVKDLQIGEFPYTSQLRSDQAKRSFHEGLNIYFSNGWSTPCIQSEA
jgi:hypothetical protein